MNNCGLYKKIKMDAMILMKSDKEKSDFLKLIISEFDRKAYSGDEFTDKKAIKIMKEMRKSAEENLHVDKEKYLNEIHTLSEYIPIENNVTGDDLKKVISLVIAENNFKLMVDLKKIFGIMEESIQFDKAEAVEIIKTLAKG